jgi:hypothetical protein
MIGRLAISLSIIAVLAASAAAQERQWELNTSEEDAYLVFGVPETDDVGVSFWCPLHSGEVRLFVPEGDDSLPRNTTIDFAIEAEGKSFAFKGKTVPNEEAGTASLEASFQVNDPLFAAMQKSDRFRITIAGKDQIYPLGDADVAGLLRLCSSS